MTYALTLMLACCPLLRLQQLPTQKPREIMERPHKSRDPDRATPPACWHPGADNSAGARLLFPKTHPCSRRTLILAPSRVCWVQNGSHSPSKNYFSSGFMSAEVISREKIRENCFFICRHTSKEQLPMRQDDNYVVLKYPQHASHVRIGIPFPPPAKKILLHGAASRCCIFGHRDFRCGKRAVRIPSTWIDP